MPNCYDCMEFWPMEQVQMLTLVTCLCCLVQEFSSDMGSRGVKRIVSRLRISQFSQVEIQISPILDSV
jgi:hypothetical protein